jgi:predicted nucleotidyltransferase
MAQRSPQRSDPIVTADEPAPFDLARIGEALNRHDVRFVLIGGVSGALHGMTEYRTKDVDLLVQADIGNRDRLAKAMTEMNATPAGTSDTRVLVGEDFAKGNTQWDTDAGQIDILITATGPNETVFVFADIKGGSELFDAGGGVTVRAASLDDLIRMKEAADRYKDHLALPELRRLRGDAHPERATQDDPFGDFDIEDGADSG